MAGGASFDEFAGCPRKLIEAGCEHRGAAGVYAQRIRTVSTEFYLFRRRWRRVLGLVEVRPVVGDREREAEL